MKAPLGLSLLLASALLAGCITGDNDGSQGTGSLADCALGPLDDPEVLLVEPTYDPLAGMTRENAIIFETTNVRTCTLSAIGHTPLRFDGETPNPHNYLGEIDMRGDLDLGAVAVLGSGEEPKIYLLDISERSMPTVISIIEQAGTYIVDVKISDDGGLLFAASQNVPTAGELAGLIEKRNGPTGFTVYDISDPANPTNVGFFPDNGFGCHMMSHEIVPVDVDVLACISQHTRLYRLERTDGGVQSLGYVDYVPASGPSGAPQPGAVPDFTGGQLSPVNQELSSRPHDMIMQVDPVTGDTVMIVSHWDEGLRVVDLNDAPQAAELGSWNGEGATHYSGNVHTAMMFYANGTRYIIASPELTAGGSVPALWVFDANDYANLELIGEWFHPGEHESQGLFLTTHQWQVAPTGNDVDISDIRIYLTMNHGGLWVLGLDDIIAGNNTEAIKGFNLARTELDPAVVETVPNAVLNTWDVNIIDGYIYGSDRATGLWVFHYIEDTLGDERLTGFA